MNNAIATTLFVIVGLINFLPISGVLGSSQLSALYGLTLEDSNLLILMRHRAALFGLIGGFLIYAAFTPSLRSIATIIGLISMLSFVYLIIGADQYNSQLRRIFIIDIIASVILIIGYLLHRNI